MLSPVDLITPLSILEKFEGGTNLPYLLLGKRKSTNEIDKFVIKFLNSERLSYQAFTRELIANLVSLFIGLKAPEPVIIEITKEFAEQQRYKEHFSKCEKSLGLNFGTKYIDDWVIWNEGLYESELLSSLQEIFIFDIFIGNTDRSIAKPNLFIKNDELFIIDHEIAFSYVLELFKVETDNWELSQGDKNFYKKHVLYESVKGKELICKNFISRLNSLDKDFWQFVFSQIPSEWQNDGDTIIQFEKIQNNSLKIVNDLDLFQNQINSFLCEN